MRVGASKGARLPLLFVLLLFAALIPGCGGSDSSTGADDAPERVVTTDPPPPAPGDSIPTATGVEAAKRPEPKVYVPDGPLPKKLVVTDMIEGAGRAVKPGDELTVNFIAARYLDGEFFESSWEWPKRFTFALTMKNVIPGWVKGLPGMREGGRRHLVIPGTLAARFGVSPSPQTEEEALVYIVDLIKVG